MSVYKDIIHSDASGVNLLFFLHAAFTLMSLY